MRGEKQKAFVAFLCSSSNEQVCNWISRSAFPVSKENEETMLQKLEGAWERSAFTFLFFC